MTLCDPHRPYYGGVADRAAASRPDSFCSHRRDAIASHTTAQLDSAPTIALGRPVRDDVACACGRHLRTAARLPRQHVDTHVMSSPLGARESRADVAAQPV